MSTATQPGGDVQRPRAKAVRVSRATLALVALSCAGGLAEASGQVGRTPTLRVSPMRAERSAAPRAPARPAQPFPIIPAGYPVHAGPIRPHAGYAAAPLAGSPVIAACSRAPCGRPTVSGRERKP